MADIAPDPRQDPRVWEGAEAMCQLPEPCSECIRKAALVVGVIDRRARQFLQAFSVLVPNEQQDPLGR